MKANICSGAAAGAWAVPWGHSAQCSLPWGRRSDPRLVSKAAGCWGLVQYTETPQTLVWQSGIAHEMCWLLVSVCQTNL